MSEPALIAHGIRRVFEDGASRVQVLDGVDLTVQRGECVAIVGASGSGKSTLLHILGGLDNPTAGEVSVAGRNWKSMDEATRCTHRNTALGFIYQFHHLLAEFTALENVAMPLLVRRAGPLQAQARAKEILFAVGLEQRITHSPGEMSGGERQRVAVARALVTQPACVLADEPTGNLDRENAQNVLELMFALARERGTAFVIATHDLQLAKRADRVVQMQGGSLVG
jgi:lipoprotein-releasing system ATP-binding protein